jgi:peptidoglycan/xylan/chitin deacetylase (PgdA/CDA1 family)
MRKAVKYLPALILGIGAGPQILTGQTGQYQNKTYVQGAITRGNPAVREIALIFSGDEFGEGLTDIRKQLKKNKVPASFFLTGRFYRNPFFQKGLRRLIRDGHYMGAHSDQHLLYCDWVRRDSLLVDKKQFSTDLDLNYKAMEKAGAEVRRALYYLPPFEWYNDTISAWAAEAGIQLINFTPGTLSHADYTTLTDKNYRSNEAIFDSVVRFETTRGLNGFILLMHVGAGPGRPEKFYSLLPHLLSYLKERGYVFRAVDELLSSQ